MNNGAKIKNPDYFLWTRFKGGDQEALEEIYQQNYQALFNYGLRIHADENLVKDVIQELFFDIISNLKKIGDTDNIRFYLIASFRRKMMLTLKKKANTILPGKDQYFVFDFDVSAEESIIKGEEDRSVRLKMRKIINNLSSRQKEAIFLKFYNNMTYEEITRIMGISYQSARSTIYKAIQTLRKILEQEIAVEKIKIH